MRFKEVLDLGLIFKRTPTKRRKTDLMILHMSGSQVDTVQGIHNYHKSRSSGSIGIYYNIVVDKEGKIFWGRGLDTEGGHVSNSYHRTKGMNARSVGICALGDRERYAMPRDQRRALKRITREVADYYGIKQILGHEEAAGEGYTDCPGKYYPLDEIRDYALRRDGSKKPTVPQPPKVVTVPSLKRNLKVQRPLMRGEDVKQVQKRLDVHLVDVGGIDGTFGAKTKKGVILFQKARVREGRKDIGKADGIVGVKTWAVLWE